MQASTFPPPSCGQRAAPEDKPSPPAPAEVPSGLTTASDQDLPRQGPRVLQSGASVVFRSRQPQYRQSCGQRQLQRPLHGLHRGRPHDPRASFARWVRQMTAAHLYVPLLVTCSSTILARNTEYPAAVIAAVRVWYDQAGPTPARRLRSATGCTRMNSGPYPAGRRPRVPTPYGSAKDGRGNEASATMGNQMRVR